MREEGGVEGRGKEATHGVECRRMAALRPASMPSAPALSLACCGQPVLKVRGAAVSSSSLSGLTFSQLSSTY